MFSIASVSLSVHVGGSRSHTGPYHSTIHVSPPCPDKFKTCSVQLGPQHTGTSNTFKHVQYVARKSVDKQAVGIRLKRLLVSAVNRLLLSKLFIVMAIFYFKYV